jgi:methionyl-tRNA formyltransferase
MRMVAEEHGLSVHDPESINDAESLELLRQFEAELYVVCDYGQILSREALATSQLGGINLHGSLLPKYWGAAPINWAMLAGERETGVTVIHMTPRLDGGPCLVQETKQILPQETAVEVEQELAMFGVEAVHKAIDMLQEWDGQQTLGHLQDASQATRAPRLKKSDGHIDWSHSAQHISNQLRALQPWPGVYTHWHGKKQPLRLILDWVTVVPDETSGQQPGTIIASDAERLWLATGDGVISLERIQPAGKRPMPIDEFLRGHELAVGDRLE